MKNNMAKTNRNIKIGPKVSEVSFYKDLFYTLGTATNLALNFCYQFDGKKLTVQNAPNTQN